jgi:FkbM family methyltransferase
MKPFRIGLFSVGSPQWLGGVFYIEHLLRAVRGMGDDKRPQVALIIDDSVVAAPDLHRDSMALVDRVLYLGGDPAGARRVAGPDCVCVSSEKALYEWVDFSYPAIWRVIDAGPSASWIPDFQHLHLPEFFTESDRQYRTEKFSRIAGNARHLVLSSECALEDYRQFFQNGSASPFVLHFYGESTAQHRDCDPVSIQRKYSLPDRFLICCNQFWAHKNHVQLFEALAVLRDRGVNIPLVCTGPTVDNRWPNFFANLKRRIDELGIGNQVRILGTLPREEQLALMRRSVALVQPSLFEGWSTVIEDGRSVGKPMLLSDTRIHREQAPAGSRFFAAQDAGALADLLGDCFASLPAGPDTAAEEVAGRECRLLSGISARDLVLLAQTAIADHRVTKPVAAPPGPQAVADPETLCNAGELAFSEGRVDAARDAFTAVLRIKPSHVRTLNNLGVLAWNEKRQADAVDLFRMAAVTNPFDPTSSLNLGEALTSMGDPGAAKKVYTDFLIRSPGHPLITKNLRELSAVPTPPGVAAPEPAEQRGPAASTLPRPTKESLLDRLKSGGLVIDTVIDVGVFDSGTPELIRAFPKAKHWLFEPVDLFQDNIHRLYASVDHELIHAACSDSTGECFQVHTSLNGNAVTHSQISDHYVAPGSRPEVVDCKPVRKIRLDDVTAGLRGGILLKVDVDGFDLQVLKGATRTLANCAVVIVEATNDTLLERASFLDRHGFDLFDVVDLTYYGPALYQCDIVFMSRTIKAAHPAFAPWISAETFRPELSLPVTW